MSRSPPSCAIATRRLEPGGTYSFRLAIGRNRRYLGLPCGCAKAKGQRSLSVVNESTVHDGARKRRSCCRPSPVPKSASRQRKPSPVSSRFSPVWRWLSGRARNTIDEKTEARLVSELMAIPGLVAQALKCESARRRSGAGNRQGPRRALSRPRHVLSLGARRRAET